MPGGDADRRASDRLRTMYLPDKVVPMLPPRVETATTLHPHQPRVTLTVAFHVTADGTVTGARVGVGRLQGAEVADYAQATAALTDTGHPLHPALAPAHAAAQALMARRLEGGALVLYDLRQGWASDGDLGLRPLAEVERYAGYLVVSELMVAANQAVVEYAVSSGVPILFRNQRPAVAPPPREELLAELRLLAGGGEQWRADTAAQRLGHLLAPRSTPRTTCTASACHIRTGRNLTGMGSGAGKTAAKAAARRLCEQLRVAGRDTADRAAG